MYEIWIEDAERELYRQDLPEGQYILGRAKQNEIYVPNLSISRQHLRLELDHEGVQVTDLGSTNGTRLNGNHLQPNQTYEWPIQAILQAGDLVMHIKTSEDEFSGPPEDEQVASSAHEQQRTTGVARDLIFSVVSAEAEPKILALTALPVFVGRDDSCAIRLLTPKVAARHCLIQLHGDRVEVTNLDTFQPAQLAGIPMSMGQPTKWQENQPLQIGSASLYLTLRPAGDTMYQTKGSLLATQSRSLGRYFLVVLPLVVLAILCLAGMTFLVIQGGRCGGLDPGCLFAIVPSPSSEGQTIVQGRATPTLAPLVTGEVIPTSIPTIEFEIGGPTPTSVPVDCTPENSGNQGWLNLPFPYKGTDPIFGGSAENFRRISQRSRFGGRINSFFDHEFPVYPPIFGGREPDDKDDTLIIFSGSRSDDAYAQDTDSSDWYSGHSGIDFAPANPREATTPILAPADGRLLLAKVDDDDNHMVWLDHDPDGDGRYQYATLYFHLFPDEHFEAMVAMDEETPVQAGQRIGTMGTTGRSSGIHLHFEVRHDVNRDRRFSIFERVDPYGWFPSQDIAEDPWSVLVSWLDAKGDIYEHEGIESEYLWVHPLVEVVDTAGGCETVTDIKVDLYNVLGWAVVDPGFTYIARDDEGQILEVGQPHRRTITILKEELEGVDPTSMSLEWLNPKLDTWFTFKKGEPVPGPGGGFTFSAKVDKTGRYVLVAQEVIDRVPPTTGIELAGNQVGSEDYVFQDSVVVTLSPMDRGLIQSQIADTQYSLDCGQSWNEYDGPFEVTRNTPHSCGESGGTSETIELEQNDFLLLAMSEDSEKNIEQPPAQIRFRLE
jgi:murein DD-endopeptidase MepM/ murein hydrolase activator NlpD/pSer/pThr/pTyr-binding forkhead associated (FHA) protein